VPTGKRALYGGYTYYNNAGGSVTHYAEIKISGTYYRLSTSITGAATTNGSRGDGWCIAEAGDIIGMNAATTAGLNVQLAIVEFDSTASLTQGRIAGPATGVNTVYTCPTGKTASIVNLNGISCMLPAGNSNVLFGLGFISDSGGVRTVDYHSVTSGSSASTLNWLGEAVIGASTRTNTALPIQLSAGDFVDATIDTGNAGQLVFVAVIER
jgi:hypothetical protein